jgi:hypothetical protein
MATGLSTAGSPGLPWKGGLIASKKHGKLLQARRVGQRLQSHRPGPDPPSPHVVSNVLAAETSLAQPAVTTDAITRAVAERFRIRLAVLRGPSRRASVVEARHLAMHLARLHSGTSSAASGAYFGGRDPATVRHACKTAVLRLDADSALAAVVAAFGRGWQKTE